MDGGGVHSLRTKRWRRQDLERERCIGVEGIGGELLSTARGPKEDYLCEVIVHCAELL
jgi:hypothetical protein